MRFLKFLLTSILTAPFLLYIFNLIGINFGILIPINIINIAIVIFLGIPGLILLLLIFVFL